MTHFIRNDWTTWTVVIAGVLSAGFLIVGEICGWPKVSANAGLILLSVLWAAFAFPLVVRERVLLVGALPALAAMFAIWIPVALKETTHIGFVVLLPLPIASAFLFMWAPVTWGLLRCMQRWHDRPRLSSFTETLAMSALMTPWLAATFGFLAILAEASQTLTTVTAIFIGLLWSKLLSDPFARFVKTFR